MTYAEFTGNAYAPPKSKRPEIDDYYMNIFFRGGYSDLSNEEKAQFKKSVGSLLQLGEWRYSLLCKQNTPIMLKS